MITNLWERFPDLNKKKENLFSPFTKIALIYFWHQISDLL